MFRSHRECLRIKVWLSLTQKTRALTERNSIIINSFSKLTILQLIPRFLIWTKILMDRKNQNSVLSLLRIESHPKFKKMILRWLDLWVVNRHYRSLVKKILPQKYHTKAHSIKSREAYLTVKRNSWNWIQSLPLCILWKKFS